MTPKQKELARHALGLSNRRHESYRNHFVAGHGHDDYAEWMEMVKAGLAVRHDGNKLPFAGDDMFCLTKTGAIAALYRGERLEVGFK